MKETKDNNNNSNKKKDEYSILGEMVFTYITDYSDDIFDWEKKSDVEKKEIEEIITLSIQTTLLFIDKLSILKNPLSATKLKTVYQLYKEEKYEEAEDFLFGPED